MIIGIIGIALVIISQAVQFTKIITRDSGFGLKDFHEVQDIVTKIVLLLLGVTVLTNHIEQIKTDI